MGELLDSLDPIFADCVGKSGRYTIGRPWVRGGFAYATNGRIVVRQPVTLQDTTHNAPDALAMFNESKPSGTIILLPDIGPNRSATMLCDECHGDGHCDCSRCGQDAECYECGGKGTAGREQNAIELATGLFVADTYVWLLQRHDITNVQVDENYKGATPGDYRYCFCRKDKLQLEGLVMGMRSDA